MESLFSLLMSFGYIASIVVMVFFGNRYIGNAVDSYINEKGQPNQVITIGRGPNAIDVDISENTKVS